MAVASPYVAIAVFCQHARQNSDGTLTIEKVVDRLTVADPSRLPQAAGLVAVIALRCEPEWGRHHLSLDALMPSGARRSIASLEVETGSGADTIARILSIDVEVAELGAYWFDVGWDGETVTKMKLDVRPKAT